MVVEIPLAGRSRKMSWKLPHYFADFRCDCRVAVATAAEVRGNGNGSRVAMVDTTEFATDRTAACAVAKPWHLPWSAMIRGTCRGNPWISTVARGNTRGSPRKCRGHCREPQAKSQIMCTHAPLLRKQPTQKIDAHDVLSCSICVAHQRNESSNNTTTKTRIRINNRHAPCTLLLCEHRVAFTPRNSTRKTFEQPTSKAGAVNKHYPESGYS